LCPPRAIGRKRSEREGENSREVSLVSVRRWIVNLAERFPAMAEDRNLV